MINLLIINYDFITLDKTTTDRPTGYTKEGLTKRPKKLKGRDRVGLMKRDESDFSSATFGGRYATELFCPSLL